MGTSKPDLITMQQIIERALDIEISRGKRYSRDVVTKALVSSLSAPNHKSMIDAVCKSFDECRTDGIRGPWLGAKRIEIHAE